MPETASADCPTGTQRTPPHRQPSARTPHPHPATDTESLDHRTTLARRTTSAEEPAHLPPARGEEVFELPPAKHVDQQNRPPTGLTRACPQAVPACFESEPGFEAQISDSHAFTSQAMPACAARAGCVSAGMGSGAAIAVAETASAVTGIVLTMSDCPCAASPAVAFCFHSGSTYSTTRSDSFSPEGRGRRPSATTAAAAEPVRARHSADTLVVEQLASTSRASVRAVGVEQMGLTGFRRTVASAKRAPGRPGLHLEGRLAAGKHYTTRSREYVALMKYSRALHSAEPLTKH